MLERGEKFAWKAGRLQERAMAAEIEARSSIEASARLWASLSVFADEKDVKEVLEKANMAVDERIPVKLEDQLEIIRGYDDKRKLIFGFGFVRYAANDILVRAYRVYFSAFTTNEQKVRELNRLELDAASFSVTPKTGPYVKNGVIYPSLADIVKEQAAFQNYGNLRDLDRYTLDLYTSMIMGNVRITIQALRSKLTGAR